MVTPWYYPIIGGTERVVETFSLKLIEHNIHSDVLTFNYRNHRPVWRDEHVTINGVDVTRIRAVKLLGGNTFLKHVPGSFRSKLLDYDIIHFHNDCDLTFPVFSWNIPRKKIFHFHCLDTTYHDYIINPIAKKALVKSADYFIALSDFLAKRIVELGIPRERVKILSNGIDTNIFTSGTTEKTRNLFLFVGRLDPKKGVPILLHALKYVRKPIKLVFIGPPASDAYSQMVRQMMIDIGKKSIHEINYLGKVSLNELITWYQKASALIIPSLSESFPMVPMEAMSCGTPVIASNVGAIPEVVHNYENGLIVQPNNPVELAKAIDYFLENESVSQVYGKAGRDLIVTKLSAEITIKHLIKIYNSML
jgi:glycosyltransferase involved in cell wall biosynthesis